MTDIDYKAMYEDCHEQLRDAFSTLKLLQNGIDKIIDEFGHRVTIGMAMPSPDYALEEIYRKLVALRPRRVRVLDAEGARQP